MKRLPPTLDVVFKMLLTRNPKLLKSMLEGALGRQVKSFQVLNPEIPGDVSASKLIVLDILTELDTGERVDVEMQVRVTGAVASRIVYYSARNYTDQLERGDDYARLRPSITVLWVAERLFPDLERFHSVFELRERHTGRLYGDDLVIHVLQLSEIHRVERPSGEEEAAHFEELVQLWGRFLAAKSELEFEQLAKHNTLMAEALEELDKLSRDPEAASLAQRRADALKFHDMELRISREEGREKGREEGREEGREGALREIIAKLCTTFGIELTVERRGQLDAPDIDLQAIIDVLIAERRWPE